jgi:hypothetical protein
VDVQALQKQIADLQEQLKSGPNHTASEEGFSNMDSVAPGDQTNCGMVAQNDTHNTHPVPGSALEKTAWTSALQQSPSGGSHPSHDLNQLEGERDNPRAIRSFDGPVAALEHSDAEGGSLDDDDQHIYGGTSILHHGSRGPLSSTSPHTSQPVYFQEMARDRLVAYAAIQKQQEMTIYSVPDITSNIDFDGVPKGTAMHLLDMHWNRQHLSYLVTHRPAIMDSLITKGPYVNKLLLNSIFFSSSLYSDRLFVRSNKQDSNTRGTAFYNRFKRLLVREIDRPSIPTVAALLTCGASLVPYGKQSAGWALCGTAYRMITDLGLDLNLPSDDLNLESTRLSAVDLEIRRRVYWGAFATDRFQCLFLGRAPTLQRSRATVSREYLDSCEEMEEWKPYWDPAAERVDTTVPLYQPRPAYAVSTFQHLLALMDIAGRIIDTFYSVSSAYTPEQVLRHARDQIRIDLLEWKDTLPTHLQFDPSRHPTPPPHQITPQ